MKKLVLALVAATALSACTSSDNILAARSQNSALVTSDDLNQARKQRAMEVEETQAQTQKANSVSGAIIGGAAAVASAAGAVHSVMSIFK